MNNDQHRFVLLHTHAEEDFIGIKWTRLHNTLLLTFYNINTDVFAKKHDIYWFYTTCFAFYWNSAKH